MGVEWVLKGGEVALTDAAGIVDGNLAFIFTVKFDI